jgi:hypothetical protein
MTFGITLYQRWQVLIPARKIAIIWQFIDLLSGNYTNRVSYAFKCAVTRGEVL